MPLVEITLIEGRPPEKLRALIHEVHEAVVRSVGAAPASVRVVLREVPPTHWAAADVTIAESRAATGRAATERAATERAATERAATEPGGN